MKSLCTLLACAILPFYASAQSVGIGTTTPDPSAVLDVSSTNKGLLLPRMTDVQMRSIASPQEGLLVFNTTTKQFYGYLGAPSTAVIEQRFASQNGAYTSLPVGQSFTATQSGRLESITIFSRAADQRMQSSVTMEVRDGDGLGGTVLATTTQNFIFNEDAIPETFQPQTYTFSQTASLIAGQIYTFNVTNSTIGIWTAYGSGYSGGQAYGPPSGSDLKFKVVANVPLGWVPLN
ncbi:hypothetical protein ACW9KT_10820 [Hymenobacter sp. HD11105]